MPKIAFNNRIDSELVELTKQKARELDISIAELTEKALSQFCAASAAAPAPAKQNPAPAPAKQNPAPAPAKQNPALRPTEQTKAQQEMSKILQQEYDEIEEEHRIYNSFDLITDYALMQSVEGERVGKRLQYYTLFFDINMHPYHQRVLEEQRVSLEKWKQLRPNTNVARELDEMNCNIHNEFGLKYRPAINITQTPRYKRDTDFGASFVQQYCGGVLESPPGIVFKADEPPTEEDRAIYALC